MTKKEHTVYEFDVELELTPVGSLSRPSPGASINEVNSYLHRVAHQNRVKSFYDEFFPNTPIPSGNWHDKSLLEELAPAGSGSESSICSFCHTPLGAFGLCPSHKQMDHHPAVRAWPSRYKGHSPTARMAWEN